MPRTKRVGEITITPEYGNLMRQFAGDALIHASVLERMEPEVIHAFRNFVVSLNIALQFSLGNR